MGRWVCVGGSVGKWTVVGWSLVGGFTKTPSLLILLTFFVHFCIASISELEPSPVSSAL